MAARIKDRTVRHDLDDYEMPLGDFLSAIGIPAEDIVAADTWMVRINGGTVVLTRHHAPQLNPSRLTSR